MPTLHKEGLRELIDHTGDICVSIYMPTHPVHIEQQQADPIRLRNLIDEARTQITRFSPFIRLPDLERLLQPAGELLQSNGDFWKHQAGGLVIFLGTDFSHVYRLPLDFEPLVIVSGRFYIRPLLPFLTEHGRFYLLTLSQNQVRLFEGTQAAMIEIELHGVPTSMKEALAEDNPEKQLQFHSGAGSPGAAGRQAAVFYSTGTPATYKKDSLLRYCQQVNTGLHKYLHHETAPLVLACVDYLFAIYKQANSYSHLFPKWVAGSPDRVTEHVLHEQTWTLIQSSFQQARQDALAQFKNLLGQGQALADVRHIVPAAFQGRVETLLIATAGQQWGFFNHSTGKVYLSGQAVPHSQDLINLAAMDTLANGGAVYTLLSGELQENIELAAVLRYSY